MSLFSGTKEEPMLCEQVCAQDRNPPKPLPRPSQKHLAAVESFLDRVRKDKVVLVVQHRFTPDVNVYKRLFQQYATNTKGSFDPRSTLGIILATLKIVSIIFDLKKEDKVEIKDYTEGDMKS